MNLLGIALKTAFPKTALAYDVLEGPIKEGVASATDPWGSRFDIVEAGKEIEYAENYLQRLKDNPELLEMKVHSLGQGQWIPSIEGQELRIKTLKEERSKIIPDKISRFIKGALGEDIDYVDTNVEEEFPLKFKTNYLRDIDFRKTAEYLKEREDYRKINQTRADILRLGLKLPQKYDSMVESEYRPTEEELRQITTEIDDKGKKNQAYVGQVGWKPNRPVWDFRDKDFYGFEGSDWKGGDPAANLDDVIRKHGYFQSPEWTKYSQASTAAIQSGDMSKEDRAYLDSKVVEARKGIPDAYEAFSDVWDFSVMEKPLLEIAGKSIGPTLGEALDYIEFYQAPQLYGRRSMEKYFEDSK